MASYCQAFVCILGHYNHTPFLRFWFVFTESLQHLKIFCLFRGSLSLNVLCCEVAQLHHDFVPCFRAWTSSTAPGQTERRVTAQNVPARFNRAHVSVKIGFNSHSTISVFVVHFLCFLVDRIVSGLWSLSIFILPIKKSVCDMCRFPFKVSEKNSLELAEEPKIANLQDSESFVAYSICYQILPAFVKQFKWLLQLTCSKCF